MEKRSPRALAKPPLETSALVGVLVNLYNASYHPERSQVSGIAAIGLEDVVRQPASQEFHQGRAEPDGASPVFLFEVDDFGGKLLMLFAVLAQHGIAMLLQDAFLGFEMRAHITNQFLQDRPQYGFALPRHHRVMKLVEQIEQMTVLRVDCPNAD